MVRISDRFLFKSTVRIWLLCVLYLGFNVWVHFWDRFIFMVGRLRG